MNRSRRTLEDELSEPTMPFMMWLRAVPEMLIYPLQVRSLGFILVGATVWSFAELFPFPLSVLSLTAAWLFIAFLYATLFRVVQDSAGNDHGFPGFSGNFCLVGDVVVPLKYMAAGLFVSYLPLIVLTCLAEDLHYILTLIWLLSAPHFMDFSTNMLRAAIIGGFYLPMAVLAMAVLRSFRALSPHVVIPAMVRTFVPYFFIAMFFLSVSTVHSRILRETSFWNSGGDGLLSMIPRPLALFATKLVLLYCYTFIARALGTLHWAYHERLRWVERV